MCCVCRQRNGSSCGTKQNKFSSVLWWWIQKYSKEIRSNKMFKGQPYSSQWPLHNSKVSERIFSIRTEKVLSWTIGGYKGEGGHEAMAPVRSKNTWEALPPATQCPIPFTQPLILWDMAWPPPSMLGWIRLWTELIAIFIHTAPADKSQAADMFCSTPMSLPTTRAVPDSSYISVMHIYWQHCNFLEVCVCCRTGAVDEPFPVQSLVFAKLRGYAPWPARVSSHPWQVRANFQPCSKNLLRSCYKFYFPSVSWQDLAKFYFMTRFWQQNLARSWL